MNLLHVSRYRESFTTSKEPRPRGKCVQCPSPSPSPMLTTEHWTLDIELLWFAVVERSTLSKVQSPKSDVRTTRWGYYTAAAIPKMRPRTTHDTYAILLWLILSFGSPNDGMFEKRVNRCGVMCCAQRRAFFSGRRKLITKYENTDL